MAWTKETREKVAREMRDHEPRPPPVHGHPPHSRPPAQPAPTPLLQSWWFSLSDIALQPIQAAPPGVLTISDNKTASPPQFPLRKWSWGITAVSAAGVESLPNVSTEIDIALWGTNDYHAQVTWTAVFGAVRYLIYRGRGGVWGYVGETTETTYLDDGREPDFSGQPPKGVSPWVGGAGNYPSVVGYHQGRRVFAGSYASPATFNASRVDQYGNFDFQSPPLADDSIFATVAARRYQEIRGLFSHQALLLLTNDAEVAVRATNDGPLTPDDCALQPQSFYGSSWLDPLGVQAGILYVQERGNSVRFLGYNSNTGGYQGPDLSLAAAHLFETSYIMDWAFARQPYSVAWVARADGVLLGLTTNLEQQIAAWHWHTLGGAGFVESLCAVPLGQEDVVFAVVNRGGVRSVERMASRDVRAAEDGVFLDAAVQRTLDVPAGSLTAPWLAGAEVTALVDGLVYPGLVADGAGVVTLPNGMQGTRWCVGFAYQSEAELLELAMPGQEIRDRPKLVTLVRFNVLATRGLWAGEDVDHLTPWIQRTSPAVPVLEDAIVEVPIESTWNTSGRAILVQAEPLPITLVGASREVEIG